MLATCQGGKEKTGEGVSFLKSSKCDVGSSELCDIFPGDQNLSEVVAEEQKKKPQSVKNMKNLHLL